MPRTTNTLQYNYTVSCFLNSFQNCNVGLLVHFAEDTGCAATIPLNLFVSAFYKPRPWTAVQNAESIIRNTSSPTNMK